LTIESVAPGIFTEDGSGRGRAVVFETTRLLPRLFFPNDSTRRFFVFVTGVSALSQATVLVDNQPVAIESLRECRHLPGLYQINIAIPSNLLITAGTSLVVKVAGKTSNATILHFE